MQLKFSSAGIVSSTPQYATDRYHCWSHGYFIADNRLLYGDDLCQWVVAKAMTGRLKDEIPALSGVFHVVVYDKIDQVAIFIQDRWGSYPMFYLQQQGTILFSDEMTPFLENGNRQMQSTAAAELLTFGHVMGNKTMLDGVFELIPHHWAECRVLPNGTFHFQQHNYWDFRFTFQSANFNRSSKAFIDLWHSRMQIIADGVRQSGKMCYTPLSAGLDSRLIAFELDRQSLPQINLTFGAGVESREINVASLVSRSLKHSMGHYVLYLNEASFEHIIKYSPVTYRLTTGHFAEKDMWFPAHFKNECGFFFSGHSGDFMAGSHLRTRMKFWKDVNPVIEYIVRFKGTPLGKHLFFTNPEYRELITASLMETLSGYPDWLNAFMNWDLEQRQRRFIMRSALSQTPEQLPLVMMPFFDYQLFDFFVDLPFEFLLDTKLYRHAQMDHLYKGIAPFDTLRANGRRVKPLISGTMGEYGYKLLSLFDKGKKVQLYDSTINWQKIAGDFVYPDCLPKEWLMPEFLPHNSRMYFALSEFTKGLNQV